MIHHNEWLVERIEHYVEALCRLFIIENLRQLLARCENIERHELVEAALASLEIDPWEEQLCHQSS